MDDKNENKDTNSKNKEKNKGKDKNKDKTKDKNKIVSFFKSDVDAKLKRSKKTYFNTDWSKNPDLDKIFFIILFNI